MANDAVFIGMEHRNLDLISTIFQTKYPRYNGRDAPLPYDELVKVDDLTNLEPENEYELAMLNEEVREEGDYDEEEEEYLEVNFPNPEYIQPLIVDGKNTINFCRKCAENSTLGVIYIFLTDASDVFFPGRPIFIPQRTTGWPRLNLVPRKPWLYTGSNLVINFIGVWDWY